MKQITFRQLQTNTKWLKDLPIYLVRYGKVVAKVIESDGVTEFTSGKGDPIKGLGEAAKEHLFDLPEKEVSENMTTPDKAVSHHPQCSCGVCKPVKKVVK